MDPNGRGDHNQVQAATGRAVGSGPPSSASASAAASFLPFPAPLAVDATVQPRAADPEDPTPPPASAAASATGVNNPPSDDEMEHIRRDDGAPVPPVQTDAEYKEMENTIQKSVAQTQSEDVPLHPSQIAALADKERGDDEPDAKKKLTPTTEAEEGSPPRSAATSPPQVQEEAPSDGRNTSAGGAVATQIGVTLDDMDEEDAPVPPAQIGAEDAAINELIETPPNVQDVPMHPSKIATGFSNVDKAMEVPQIVKKEEILKLAQDHLTPADFKQMYASRLQRTRERVRHQQEEILQQAQGPPTLPVVRAPSPPPTDQGWKTQSEDVPLPPSQMAALADKERGDDETDAKKKPAPTTEAEEGFPPRSAATSPPQVQDKAIPTQLPSVDPPASPLPSAEHGESLQSREQQTPIQPPPQSIMPPPDDDTDPPVSALLHDPSVPELEATLVEDQAEIPVYDAIQVAEQTRFEKNKKLIIGLGMGLLIGAVAAGVSVSSNNGSDVPSLRPTLGPLRSRQGLGFNGDASTDLFGLAVAFSADATTMAIGAPGDIFGKGSKDRPGSVKVYGREGEGSNWEQRGDTLRGEAIGDNFGRSLALSEDGTTLSIGAPLHDSVGSDSGQVKVYEWDESTLNYAQIGDTLYGAASGDRFGYSLDITNGKILAVGADKSDTNGSDSGQVTIYAWDDASSNFKQRGEAIDGDAAGDGIGSSVSLAENGQKLAVGAPFTDSNGSDSGQVRVFEWDEATSNYEQLGGSLLGDVVGEWFGWSVSFSHDGATLAIGAPSNSGNGRRSGQVKVFAWDEAASNFEQIGQSLNGKAASDYFGISVSLSWENKTLAIGAHQFDAFEPGYVEVYEWDEAGSEYKRHGQRLGGEASGDNFGSALALAGNGRDLVIGAPWNDRNGTDSGRVEVFHIEL